MPSRKRDKQIVRPEEDRPIAIMSVKATPQEAGGDEIERLELLLPDGEVFNLVDALLRWQMRVGYTRPHQQERPALVIRVDLKQGRITLDQDEWKPTYPGRSKKLDRAKKRDRKKRDL